MRSHTRTLDEDVFARFLQAFRKRRFVVQTRQRGFAGKETTPDIEILGISVLDMEHCRFKHEVDVPSLADPQTQNTDFYASWFLSQFWVELVISYMLRCTLQLH